MGDEKRMMKFVEDIRMFIAYRLDKNPVYCWTELVLWAKNSSRRLKDCKKSNMCLYDDGSCYCGKIKQRETRK